MGEIADMMLDGTLCQQCGCFLGDDQGYPQTCSDCAKPGRSYKRPSAAKQEQSQCHHCKKWVTSIGLPQHIAAKHPDQS